MAVRTDIQYVRPYTDGSAARKLDRTSQGKHPVVPKRRRVKPKTVKVDPVLVLGAAVLVCLLVVFLISFVQLQMVQAQSQQMSQYIEQLQQENQQLQQTYENGYDLEQIRDIAEALGMIPAGDATQIEIQVQVPQEEVAEEMTLWESFTTFLAGLFA